jgi:dTDP-4-amino-4,6-dideoxy-D-galactose acyltransferase
MRIEKLSWDTDFFGFNVGRVTIYDEDDFHPLEFKKQAIDENYELVYVFKYSKMLTWQKVIKADLEMVDIMLTMSKKFDKNDYRDISYDFRTKLSNKELEECYYIAEQTAIVSRFYKEKKIGPEKTRSLYIKWIDNAINKSFSDGLFLEKEKETVIGIHLLKTDKKNKMGQFTLTGVHPNYKRMGIGYKLWTQSFGFLGKESKIDIVKSPFSFQNTESLNFHLKMGFDITEEIKYIYHFRNITEL